MLSLKNGGEGIATQEAAEIRYFTSEKLIGGNEKEEAKVSGRWDV